MSEETPSKLDALLDRARKGDEAAADEVVKTYGPALHRVMRRLLDQNEYRRLRVLFDSDDFLQDSWEKLFLKALQESGTFNDPKTFLAFMSRIAENQVRTAHKKFLVAKKRNLDRQEPLDPDDC